MKFWLNVAEGAQYAGVCRDLIYDACAARKMHHIRVGGRRAIRLKPEWIDAWLERHTVRMQEGSEPVRTVGGQVCIQRSAWKGHVTAPKGERLRYVPMTSRLATGLRAHRHLRGPLVVCGDEGAPLTQHNVQAYVKRAARRANLSNVGVHVLRHTFCSHLAMRGAPARAIQEVAGHSDLSTTQWYMHLNPAAVESAIRLLDQRGPIPQRGDIAETGVAIAETINK